MPRIFDNSDARLDEALRQSLPNSHQLDACVGYFNLRGWGLLAGSVDDMSDPPPGEPSPSPKVRLLLGMADPPRREMEKLLKIGRDAPRMDNRTAARLEKETLDDLRRQLTLGLPTSDDQAALRHLTRSLRGGRACARLFLRHRLHAKLYLCHRDDPDNPMTGFVGSSNLTLAGLAREGELNVDVLDHDAVAKLHDWFENLWRDQYTLDITPELIEALEESWAGERPLPPYLIYLKLAYHLSREAREGLVEYGLPQSMADDLFDYQAAAVRIAARILNRRGGVMVGDVVGLGKTMIAAAIALLLQEETGSETLIVCPKNLVTMWQGYVEHYRLHARVLSLSLAARDLPEMRRYRVVVIDESHNLRTSTRKDYIQLKDYIGRNDSKVILLTATPYNKRFLDVANQLGLFVDPDADLGIRPERHIMKTGDVDFLRQCNDKPQTLGAFRRSEEAEDYRRLMSLFLVRRTRRFIEKNYGENLTPADGRPIFFPRRVPHPLRHEVPPDSPTAAMMSDRTLDSIDRLSLPRYTLAKFLHPQAEPTEAEAEIMERWRKASVNLIGITRTRLYKRLSSSGAVFRMSLERHLLRDHVYLHAIRRGLPLPIGHYENPQWEDEEDAEWPGEESPDAAPQSPQDWERAAAAVHRAIEAKAGRAVNWVRPELFTGRLAEKLKRDCALLEELLGFLGEWRQEEDSKLDALQELLQGPHRRDKVLVFTEYRDTAEYVARALRGRGVESVEAVSGSSDDPTAAARRFSPKANRPIGGLPADAEEIRVLVATDVLSEGQNLQDSHIVVNFDLPWAIVKIIQRAGRVDRIGQENREVLVYSFLPAEGVEAVIGLRKRIARRLAESAYVFGSDETFFGEEGEQRFLEGLYDENSRLDWEEPDEEVDWASHAYEIWRHAEEHHPELAKQAEALPDGVYATTATPPDGEAGVLACAEKTYGLPALAFTNLEGDSRLLDPYQALQIAQCEPDDNATPPPHIPAHHDLVAAAVTGPLLSPAAHREGSLTGIRKRCWDRLRNYQEKYPDSLFIDENAINKALDELYRKPLLEDAANRLAKALRERTPEDLAPLIIALHEAGNLCLPEDKLAEGEVRLLCSMGFAP